MTIVMLGMVAMIGLAPTTSASGGSCLFCKNAPFGAGINGLDAVVNTNCGILSTPYTPQTTSTQATAESFALSCRIATVGQGDHESINSAGFNRVSWTASVAQRVTVYAFWNVSWALNISTYSYNGNCAGAAAMNAHADVQINVSVWDSTSSTAIGRNTLIIQALDTPPLYCNTNTTSIHGTTHEMVSFSFVTIYHDVYYFDTRLVEHDTAVVTCPAAATPNLVAAADSNVANGNVATVSSLEVY
jgi:hypothetical protein